MPAPQAGAPQFSVDTLLQHYPPEIRAIVAELRNLVQATIPQASEKANPGWRSLNCRHPAVGYFCGLFPFEDHVDVAFEFGALLPDPEETLDAGRKQVRYARVTSLKAIPRRALKHLLKDAVSLPAERSTRTGLVRAGARPELRKVTTPEPATSPRRRR